MDKLLPDNVEIYWIKNMWDREVFEQGVLGPKFKHKRELLLQVIKKFKPENILILCCGVGLETSDIKKLLFLRRIVCVDINPSSCEKTRQRVGNSNIVTILNKNVYDIDFVQAFDAVVCMDALHHLGRQDILLSKINKAIKKDGVFIGDYFGKERFIPWQIHRHGLIKYWLINSKHHISNLLLKFNILPNRLVEAGWMRTFLYTKEQIINKLQEHKFKILELISDEWHFFVAQKI